MFSFFFFLVHSLQFIFKKTKSFFSLVGLATIAEGLRPEGEKKADVEARKAEIKRLREGAVDRLIADLEGQAAEMVRMAEDKEAAAKALAAEAARSTKPLGNEPEIQQSGWWRWLSWKRVN